ncbi:unnamed protein product [Musa acuminata subsp. malaccensis]|uniref:(wild Malaysian banana) hypothetical protein n=1 Tax=Musa acuminata subsp. malaccensis TaxID=214687 RepID=A0A804K6A0_MUSAM|nr:unnamed protein product [Musa acuminata subsp. malaccensis]
MTCPSRLSSLFCWFLECSMLRLSLLIPHWSSLGVLSWEFLELHWCREGILVINESKKPCHERERESRLAPRCGEWFGCSPWDTPCCRCWFPQQRRRTKTRRSEDAATPESAGSIGSCLAAKDRRKNQPVNLPSKTNMFVNTNTFSARAHFGAGKESWWVRDL